MKSLVSAKGAILKGGSSEIKRVQVMWRYGCSQILEGKGHRTGSGSDRIQSTGDSRLRPNGTDRIRFETQLQKFHSTELLMTSPHRESNDDRIPLAYFITFRAYGTWLHGDERGSVDRLHNTFGSPRLLPNPLRRNYERRILKRPPTHLSKNRRAAIERGIRETCNLRNWSLWAFNIRTNHVHIVVSANCKSERVLAALKANATRTLREARLWQSGHSPWARKGSRKHLWTERQLNAAIDYVLYDQGEPLP